MFEKDVVGDIPRASASNWEFTGPASVLSKAERKKERDLK
jgi:hypothetical protein